MASLFSFSGGEETSVLSPAALTTLFLRPIPNLTEQPDPDSPPVPEETSWFGTSSKPRVVETSFVEPMDLSNAASVEEPAEEVPVGLLGASVGIFSSWSSFLTTGLETQGEANDALSVANDQMRRSSAIGRRSSSVDDDGAEIRLSEASRKAQVDELHEKCEPCLARSTFSPSRLRPTRRLNIRPHGRHSHDDGECSKAQ